MAPALFAAAAVSPWAPGGAVASQEPAAQSQQGVTRQLYLLPADNSRVQLQTHLVKLNVAYHSDGSVSAIMDADVSHQERHRRLDIAAIGVCTQA